MIIKAVKNASIRLKLTIAVLSILLISLLLVSGVLYWTAAKNLESYEQSIIGQRKIAVDATIGMLKQNIADIAYFFAPYIVELVEKENYDVLRKELKDLCLGDGVTDNKDLFIDIAIVTDINGRVLARSGSEMMGDYVVEDFGNAITNGLNGKRELRKIIFDKDFIVRENYNTEKNHLMGLTVIEPLFNEKGKQVGLLILIAGLNENLEAIKTTKVLNDIAFTAYLPSGEVATSYFKIHL